MVKLSKFRGRDMVRDAILHRIIYKACVDIMGSPYVPDVFSDADISEFYVQSVQLRMVGDHTTSEVWYVDEECCSFMEGYLELHIVT